ncbi:MAG: hypothetical protein Ct9H300mP32_6250 [Verrucomicrobiota bacterium]|nr:MAG: hypothetical protein Ct9H300mP32_6250 [Verrucomicrobiota bacterium]
MHERLKNLKSSEPGMHNIFVERKPLPNLPVPFTIE